MQILREQTPEEGGGMFRRKGLKNVQQCSRLDIEMYICVCVNRHVCNLVCICSIWTCVIYCVDFVNVILGGRE